MIIYTNIYAYAYIYTQTHTMEYYYSSIKKGNSTICNNMEGSRGHYAQWNVRQIHCVVTYMWNLENKMNEYNKIETDS